MLCPEMISPKIGISLIRGISILGTVVLFNAVEAPLLPVNKYKTKTVPPFAMALMARPHMMLFAFNCKIKYASIKDTRIPAMTPTETPRKQLWVFADTTTPVKALISIIPSMAILATPARSETNAAMPAK